MKNRTLLTRWAFQSLQTLVSPLTGALDEVQARLEALEAAAGFVVLPEFRLTTGASVGPAVAPFPFVLTTPATFTPVGAVILNARNITNPAAGGIGTGGLFPWIEPSTDGAGKVVLRYVTGLAVSTQYALTLGVFRG